MSFREIPKKFLALGISVLILPLAIGVAAILPAIAPDNVDMHGHAGIPVLVVWGGWILAAVIQIIAIPQALFTLLKDSEQRNRSNVIATLISLGTEAEANRLCYPRRQRIVDGSRRQAEITCEHSTHELALFAIHE